MKTEAIRQAAERLRAQGHFGLASQVEEEADAAVRVAQELDHLVRLLEPLEKEGGLNVPGLATLNGARFALKRARGAL